MYLKNNIINVINNINFNSIFGRRFILILIVMMATFYMVDFNVSATISPDFVQNELETGGCYNVTKTVEIPITPPKADVVFAFDLTNSMDAILNTTKLKAGEIMNTLITSYPEVSFTFGVMSYTDYPNYYSSCGYSAAYGSSSDGDYAYSLDQPLTSNTTNVTTAINSLSLGYGWDAAEAYTRIFYESYADSNIGWRTRAKKYLINFGDNVPHDCNLNEGIANGTWSKGMDPGRDEIMFTSDDLDLQSVLASMNSSGVTLIECHSDLTYMNYWDYWTSITGGSVYIANSSTLVDDVVNEISSGATDPNIYDLHLEVTLPGYSSWLTSTVPSSYPEVITGTSVTFIETICVPIEASPGLHIFNVSAVDGYGVNYGNQTNEITVNNPPVANNDNAITDEDIAVWIDVLANDSDSDGTLNLSTVTVTDGPSDGNTIVNITTGEIQYIPDPDFYGFDSFTYTVDDDDGATSNIATVIITVNNVNDPPVITNPDNTTAIEDEIYLVDYEATDVDFDILNWSLATDAGFLSIVTNTGVLSGTPDNSNVGSYYVNVSVDDGNGGSDFSNFTLVVLNVNDPPIADDDFVTVMEDSTWNIIFVLDNDSDPDGDSLSITSVTQPSSGLVTNNGTFVTYTPAPDFNGGDLFNYNITDGFTFDTASVYVTVSGVNDPPNKPNNPDPYDNETGVNLNPILSVNVSDPDGDPLNVSFYNAADNGFIGNVTILSNSSTASITWSGRSYSTTYSWYAIANDSQLETRSNNWSFTTKAKPISGSGSGSGPPANKHPTADANGPYLGFIDEEIEFDGSGSSDSDGTITNYTWDFGDGRNGYGKNPIHAYDEPGEYTVKLTVKDDDGDTDTDVTNAQISLPNTPPTTPIVDGPTTGHKNTTYNYTALSYDEDNDTIQYIFNWGDGTNTTTAFLPNGTSTLQTHTWNSYGKYIISVKAFDDKTESGTTEYTILIDILPIDDEINGNLVDKDSDDTYDSFDNTDTGKQTDIEKENQTYLIDIDGDGKWDYAFNLITGLSTYRRYVYLKYLAIYEAKKAPGFEILSVLVLIALLLIILRRRR